MSQRTCPLLSVDRTPGVSPLPLRGIVMLVDAKTCSSRFVIMVPGPIMPTLPRPLTACATCSQDKLWDRSSIVGLRLTCHRILPITVTWLRPSIEIVASSPKDDMTPASIDSVMGMTSPSRYGRSVRSRVTPPADVLSPAVSSLDRGRDRDEDPWGSDDGPDE